MRLHIWHRHLIIFLMIAMVFSLGAPVIAEEDTSSGNIGESAQQAENVNQSSEDALDGEPQEVPLESNQADDLQPNDNELEDNGAENQISMSDPEPDIFNLQPASSIKQSLPDVDVASGALTYSYPLRFPAGRGGVQPDIALSYNNQNNEEGSLFGFGWNLSIPTIERRNLNGTDNMYDARDFTASLDGELTYIEGAGTILSFGAQHDSGTYTDYTFHDEANESWWTARTKSGITYTFGSATSSRLDNPSNQNQIFRWYLTKIEDVRGNNASFSYVKVDGQVYPQTIRYTNFNEEAGLFRIEFKLEGRQDMPINAKPGFSIRTIKRIKQIEAYIGDSLTSVYTLGYQYAPVNGRSRLISIALTGYSENGQPNSDPATAFEYESIGATSLLTKITQSTGGITTVIYKPSTQYRNLSGQLLNPRLPFVANTVEQLQYDDGNGTNWSNTFEYSGGWYYYDGPFDRRFVGFERVIKTDATGNKTVSYYHQGNGNNAAFNELDDSGTKAGKLYKTELLTADGAVYKRILNTWTTANLGNGRSFVKIGKTLEQTFDGNATHRDRATSYTYNNTNGNITEQIEWGEVSGVADGSFTDIGSDDLKTVMAYATNGNGTYAISSQAVSDHFGQTIKKDRTYYDELPFGQLTSGNATKQEQWKSGSNYISATKVYDEHGLVIEDHDPRNKVTTYVYDEHYLYPITVTNPLGNITTSEYDYSLGKPKHVISPNGFITETVFDGKDRSIVEKQSDIQNPSSLVVKTVYEYTDTPNALKIKKISYLDDTNGVETYTYYDGFDRVIQERTETEIVNQFSVKDTVYNNRGLILKESLPYFSTGSAKTTATSTTALYTKYAYDPLQRPLVVTTAAGTTTTFYDDWKSTIHDADNKARDIYRDAFDNIIQVDEHDQRAVYSTYYAFNALKKLTRITDAMGNVRNFAYDALGRALEAEDLHDPADATFGVWHYEHDDVGNVLTRTDAIDQVTTYEYDDLNRILTETHSGNQITYEYDNCPYGIGLVCHIETPALTEDFEYTVDGKISKNTRMVNGTAYETSYAYDRQGNQRQLTNPDDSIISYEYNNGGQLESVRHKETDDADFRLLVSDYNYGPTGDIIHQAFSNGVTDFIYDANELYRLRRKTTMVGSNALQDLIYSYDPVGNITRIVDDSDTPAAKITDYSYDDLHRLIQAVTTAATSTTETYAYDAIGNIISTSDNGAYTYEGNQGSNYANPHAVTNINGNEYTYDQNGNMLTAGREVTYVWDYNNRLIETRNNEHTIAYTYDASGQRLTAQSDNEPITVYLTASYNIGDMPTKHVFANGVMIATVEGSGKDAKAYDVHTDHLTGSNVISDDAGQVAEVTDYHPFGEIRMDSRSGNFNEQRKFAGHEYDTNTGLTYMNARYYDPKIGRFLSEDPVFNNIMNSEVIEQKTKMTYENYLSNPQSLNSFAYVNNNPLKYVDPKGEFLDIALDVGFIGYDLYSLNKAIKSGGNVKGELGSLGLDIAGAVLPFATGLGMAARVTRGAEKAAEIAEIASKVGGTEKYIDNINEVIPLDRQNHILYGDSLTGSGGHKSGANIGKPEFPASWSDKQIFHNAVDVATDPLISWTRQLHGNYIATGFRDNIEMSVIINKTKSFIISAFPKIR